MSIFIQEGLESRTNVIVIETILWTQSFNGVEMTRNIKIALVFSGGGARGAYQIGVWQALVEKGLSQHICGVYGTSVGAINAAAFAQGDINLAKEVWQQINYNNVFASISEDALLLRPRKRYYQWVKSTIKDGGMDVSPLKELLRQSIDETIIRQSEIAFGLVTYNLTNRNVHYLTKSAIPRGQLVEYVIASATFPTFQPHRIEGSLYIDGGIVDNRPVGFMMDDNSIDAILCIDVTIARHFWTSKRKVGETHVHFIRPSRLLGSPLAFRPEKIARNMDLGYQDAMLQLDTFIRQLDTLS